MKKISELTVGSVVEIVLVVKSATARKTKAGKDYLAIEFFDGRDSINGNYWDWAGANIPEKNTVLNVYAQVGEWAGNKQLNVHKITTNTEVSLTDFMPTSGEDPQSIYTMAYALMTSVKDDFLRSIALGLLEDLQQRWLTVPGAKGVHHAFVAGTLIHSYTVATIAKAMAENVSGANVDLCVVGGMLHDLGKLYAYKIDGVTIDMTIAGMLKDHIFMGAEFVGNYADDKIRRPKDASKLELLRHIILSHHGTLEHGAVVPPQCIEAYIVWHADELDAAAEQIREASRTADQATLTDRIWALNNRPHLSTGYIQRLMQYDSEE